MKYLLIQLFLLFSSVTFLYYFSTLPGFTPFDPNGLLDWVKIGSVFFLIFILLESFISILVYIFEKLIAYGKKEFPNSRLSLKWGIGIALGLVAILFLHINHIITLGWGVIILVGFIVILFIL